MNVFSLLLAFVIEIFSIEDVKRRLRERKKSIIF